MDFSNANRLTIPEGAVKQIICNGVVIWEEYLYTNLVPLSTEADGTPYNGGKGYKDGYRIRSGGAEATQGGTTITGYIPYRKGDKLYIYPKFVGGNTWNTVNFYNDAFACLGQVTDSGSYYGFCNRTFKTKVVNGVSVLDISAVTVSGIENVAYVRIGNMIDDKTWAEGGSSIKSGSEMIITKNEEIVDI